MSRIARSIAIKTLATTKCICIYIYKANQSLWQAIFSSITYSQAKTRDIQASRRKNLANFMPLFSFSQYICRLSRRFCASSDFSLLIWALIIKKKVDKLRAQYYAVKIFLVVFFVHLYFLFLSLLWLSLFSGRFSFVSFYDLSFCGLTIPCSSSRQKNE